MHHEWGHTGTMVRSRSLAGPVAGTLLLVLFLGGAALAMAWVGHLKTLADSRDDSLRAAAATVAIRLHQSRVMDQGEEAASFASAVRASSLPESVQAIQVLTPASDVPTRWRVSFAAPEQPEAALPLSDPGVQRALAGGEDPITWHDPAGTGWRSVIVPVIDRTGHQLAMVEARSPVTVVVPQPLAIAGALFAVAVAIGIAGVLLALHRTRDAMRTLSAGISGAGRGESPIDDGSCIHELGGLAGSLQQMAEDTTTRRIRQRRELADLRVQVARFQGADRAKTTLLVALCRSLRQSVDTLRSSGSLLSQTRLDRTQRDYVDSLQSGCGDLLTRIGDVLDFALLEAECLSLDQRPMRPRIVLEEAILIVAERCSQLPIELAWHADAEVPERVIGDVARVRQVLVNLVGLAAGTAEEGTVSVHLSVDSDLRLNFRISLMGVTLTAERIRLLLEGAISSDSSSDRLHGEGLGLVLGKRLAQAMGGSLTIERGADDGIELVCTLRISPDEVAPERPLQRRLVVIAHERPATSRMVAGILERAGAEVAMVTSRVELNRRLATGPHPDALVASSRLVALDTLLTDVAGIDGVGEGIRQLAGSPPLLLLVDPIHRGMSTEMRAAGAVGLLTSPVRQQALISAAMDAVSGTKRDSSITPALQPEAPAPRVLVVEDNQVNQLVLVRMLESTGIRPEVAGNGLEAVERIRSAGNQPFGLILMDCMMPVMDGITATRTIRQEEEREPGVWIVAVTANALANDRTKCLAAGMNDYLAKPVTPLSLADALNRWKESTGMVRRGSARIVITKPEPTPPLPGVTAVAEPEGGADFAGLRTLARLAGPSAVNEVIGCFLAEAEAMRAAVDDAVQAGDSERIRATAHKLKGSSGTVGLRGVQAAAAAIETAARSGDMGRTRGELAVLSTAMADGVRRLGEYRDRPE